jgi:tripartite-type tricarboxylate transporter receptor subunit TctC
MKLSPSFMTGLLFAASIAFAADPVKDFPSKPVRIVSPFAAGGTTDTLSRSLAPKLFERLGQPVIVENRPGAGGMTGTNYVAKSAPDGHTLLFMSGAYTAHSATVKNLPYDPIRDFEGVSMVTTYPFAVVTKIDSAVRSIGDLISAAKNNPGKLNYGSVGVGSVFHLAAELFNVMAGTDITHVPYKGGAEPLTELIGGRIDVIFNTLPGIVPHVKSGRVRALAVASLERSAQLPEVPTVAQTLPGYEVTSFAGVVAPRGTPRQVIERLNRELRAVLELPEIRKQFTELGGDARGSTPEAMVKHYTDEIAKWKRVVEARKIEIQ